jgi:glycolate oxidase iron-sulfur subunit
MDKVSHKYSFVTEELTRCAKCGTCRSTCPVFKETLEEGVSTRGKLALFQSALKGDLKASKKLKEILDYCLMCTKCRVECPSLVKTDWLIRLAREWLNEEIGIPLSLKFVFRFIIPYRKIYNLTLRIIRLFVRKGSKRMSRHLPLALSKPLISMPTISAKQVLQKIRNPKSEIRNNQPRVAIFTGCLINYVYPEIYHSATKLLDKAGISYITPRDQLCCGTPLLLYGDTQSAKRIINRNIAVFSREKVDAIVTLCASCGRTLKEDYPQLQIPVRDIVEVLTQVTRNKLQVTRNDALQTIYHEPCHFLWSEAGTITKKLLGEISNYKETDEEGLCCGGGGSFAFRFPELSDKIGSRKMDLFRKKTPDIITTGCPGCIMQLRYLTEKSGLNNIKVCHTVELLVNLSATKRKE